MRFILIIFTLLFLTGGHSVSLALEGFEVCDPSNNAAYEDLANSPWNSVNARPGYGVIYAIGAPWCPYCKRVYMLAQSGSVPIEFRFLGMDPFNTEDFKKIADNIKHGEEGIKRTYLGKKSKPMPIKEIDYLSEGAIFTAFALKARFKPIIKRLNEKSGVPKPISWGSPVIIGIFDKHLVPFIGVPKLEAMANDLKPHSAVAAVNKTYLKTPPIILNSIKKTVTIKKGTGSVFAFPSYESVSLCPTRSMRLTVVGKTTVQGLAWFKVKAFETANNQVGNWRSIHAYVPVSEVE